MKTQAQTRPPTFSPKPVKRPIRIVAAVSDSPYPVTPQRPGSQMIRRGPDSILSESVAVTATFGDSRRVLESPSIAAKAMRDLVSPTVIHRSR